MNRTCLVCHEDYDHEVGQQTRPHWVIAAKCGDRAMVVCRRCVEAARDAKREPDRLARLLAENESLKAQLAECASANSRLSNMRIEAERDQARTLARFAVNGWACYATRKIEHNEIARIHTALNALPAPPEVTP